MDPGGPQPGLESIYTYDPAGRLTALTHQQGTPALAAYAYAYDAANRITQVSSADRTSAYTYDDRDQLIGADHSDQGDEAYRYDANGNRTHAGYITGPNNQLLSDGQYSYEYDAEGNLTRQTDIATGQVTELTWDHRNRLLQVTEQDAAGNILQTAAYGYDLYNRRIAKVVDLDGAGAALATTERFVYNNEHIALVFDGNGQQTHRYLHGPRIDQVLAEETPTGQVVWALADHQGTVRDWVDSQGVVMNHLSYDSFGNLTHQTNPTAFFRFGYTGREHDLETGYIYYRNRYTFKGRFISQDPLSFAAGDANLYRYVGNNPLNLTDPSGLYGRVLYQQRELLYNSTIFPVIFRAFEEEGGQSGQFISAGATIPFGERDVNAYPKFFSPAGTRSVIWLDITNATIEWNANPVPHNTVEPWGGRRAGDDNGHIIPRILGGTGYKKHNFFSQTRNINRNEYNQFSIALNEKLDMLNAKYQKNQSCPKPMLEMKVALNHGISLSYPFRPNSLTVTAEFSDGKVITEHFSNDPNAKSTRNRNNFRKRLGLI